MQVLKLENVKKYYGVNTNITKAVDGVSFSVDESEFVAIMGASGSGKTTLLNCISTIDNVTSGNIIVGDKNITQIKEEKLADFRKENLGFVFQDFNILEQYNVYENIELALKLQNKNLSLQEMDELLRLLDPEGLEKRKINELSGGQKQRLSIARAVASDPEIYVFDDSFSALDYKTDCALREDLKAVTKDKTVIIVAQRINTVLNADQIITLEDGNIVGKGTHEELMKNCETYRQIALSQLSEEELNKTTQEGSENK